MNIEFDDKLNDESVTVGKERKKERWQNNIKTISDGILHIYKTKQFSDATYIVSGEQFKVHSLILAARSPEFKRIFAVPNAPKEVNDVGSPIGFKLLLKYIYTDELGTTDRGDTLEAYRAAKKFQQEELITLCEKLMAEWEFTVDNVFSTLNTGLETVILRDLCLDFVFKNAETAIRSPDFMNVTPPALLKMFDKKCFTKVPTIELMNAVLKWGLDKFTELEDYRVLRQYLMANQILGKLKWQKLSITQLLQFANSYPNLITAEEILKFQMYTNQPESNLPLPNWAEQ